MTPQEVLEEACSRFVVLYHKDPQRLHRLLLQALGKFQDKAGALMELWLEKPDYVCPPYLNVAAAWDHRRRHIPWRLRPYGHDGHYVELLVTRHHEAPFCICHFANLRKWPLTANLPPDVPPLLTDYLEALIAVPNVSRERNIYLLSGMQDSAQSLPSEQELRQRIKDIEDEMASCKALVPPASMF